MAENTIDEMFARYGPNYKYLVTFAGMIGVIAMVLSVTIANVAIPSVMGAYGIGQDQAQWMATAFIATMTLSQLLNSWIVDAFGPRLGFMFIIVVFLLGTAICALSPTYDFIILGRVLQGFSAGVSQPLVMALLFRVFPSDRRAFAMGLYGMAIMLAPGLGPVVGGIAIDWLSWRHIFYIPLPFCIAGLVAAFFFMPGGMRVKRFPPFDWTGFLLLATALVLLLSSLADGQRHGWLSNEIMIRLGVGFSAAAAFVVAQLNTDKPLLDVTLFRDPAFASATMVGFVVGFGNMSSSYAIPVFVQTVQGFSATEAGLVLVPAGIVMMISFPFTGRVADHVPAHFPIMLGLIFFAAGAVLMSGCDINSAFWFIAITTIIGRFGMALIIPALTNAGMKNLSQEKLNPGAGGMNFMRQLGGSFGISLFVVWTEQRTQIYSDALTATQTPANSSSSQLLQLVSELLNAGGVSSAIRESGALHFLGNVVQAQATTFGFQDGFLFIAAVFICALIPTWIVKRAGRTGNV